MIENPLPSAPDSVKEKFYDDAIHPAAKQVGYIAETIVMAVNKKTGTDKTMGYLRERKQ